MHTGLWAPRTSIEKKHLLCVFLEGLQVQANALDTLAKLPLFLDVLAREPAESRGQSGCEQPATALSAMDPLDVSEYSDLLVCPAQQAVRIRTNTAPAESGP